MRRDETITVLGIIILVGFIAFVVIDAAHDAKEIVAKARAERQRLEDVDVRVECAQYYNDGTGRWQVCMGVGPK